MASVDVYWFQEAENGTIQLPSSWRLLYKEGADWKPVEAAGSYETLPDRYNYLPFKPVTTRSLRLEVQLKPDKSAGISEWKVN